MITIDNIIKRITKESGINAETVDKVCKHVFKYSVNIMKDEHNVDDILFNELFKFKLKSRYKKEKSLNYISK